MSQPTSNTDSLVAAVSPAAATMDSTGPVTFPAPSPAPVMSIDIPQLMSFQTLISLPAHRPPPGMSNTLEEQLGALTLNRTALSRSPSPTSSLSSSTVSTEYFSDEDSPSEPTPARGPPVPASRPCTPEPPTHLPSSPRLYTYSSPSKRAVTHDWAEAAHATIGIPNAGSQRLTPRRRKNKPSNAYTVFFGRNPGWYNSWDQVQSSVQGVRGAIYQGYHSDSAASSAYEYARVRLWTGVCSTSPNAPLPWAHLRSRQLPVPFTGTDSETNTLHCGKWYVVYKGLSPGVYQSFLECGINTVGIRGSAHDAADSLDAATISFLKARDAGETASYPASRVVN
ncbi:hypothetical protein C8R47DRAFT_1210705 [Mycena vitilis]|nr:hypothetical protein C8R47DRAFT_1210705 [Mycena vitilis]